MPSAGIELATSQFTNQRSDRLSYAATVSLMLIDFFFCFASLVKS